MRNDEVLEDAPQGAEPRRAEPEPERLPSPAPPLLILATDDDAVCVDDLCLPAEARP